MGQQLLTISEVAKFLRLHHSTVYRLAREERLPAVKIGSQWRFHRSHIEQWLDEQCL
ncbi:MAG: helix-turn-helix domain-containing protein [Nitrospirae bacterium]|nr:helix-turn-helix domain-containing protein [Nitrospirota bacterium]